MDSDVGLLWKDKISFSLINFMQKKKKTKYLNLADNTNFVLFFAEHMLIFHLYLNGDQKAHRWFDRN